MVFEPGRARWVGYKFARGAITLHSELVGYALTTTPPSLWRRSPQEVLFVPAGQKDELVAWCTASGVPLIEPEDVWELLLEPFLDTVHSEEWQLRTRAQLRECGFSDEEVEAIRARYRERVLRYNAILWDWVYLGQLDLLEATGGSAYWESMKIAWRGLRAWRRDP